MRKKILWVVVSGLMMLSLVMAACGPAETPTTPTIPTTPTTPAAPTTPTTPTAPSQEKLQQEAVTATAEKPKYGGTLTLSNPTDLQYFDGHWNLNTAGSTPALCLTNQGLWSGDWTKGPAGGYGTNQTDWSDSFDLFDLKTGYLAEEVKWTADFVKSEGTIIYKIRQGVHWGLNPNLEASRLVNGREFTTDDVIAELKRGTTWARAYIYGTLPELRDMPITKTGPWEITLKVPISSLYGALARLGDATVLHPPEVITKYGDANKWQSSVGTGPFILTDFVPASGAVFVRNPNYWMTNPIGPGKGDQLPYADGVRLLIIPDKSTELAALRTGKIDRLTNITWEDAAQLRKTNPELKEAPGSIMSSIAPIYIKTTIKPFTDVNVRRAMLMATDLNLIRDTLNGGLGQILTTPYPKVRGYDPLYLGLDDPDCTPEVKELYVYNPQKAKQLLTEAGYPNGFKTTVLITAADVDYYSVIKDMWAKVGIDLSLDVRESGTINNLRGPGMREYQLMPGPHPPVPTWYMGGWIGVGGLNNPNNYSQVSDSYILEQMVEINKAIFTKSELEAMKMMRELMKYVLPQVYAIPRPRYNLINMWWPWLKNYSGEHSIGYYRFIGWTQWVWVDQNLKENMGY